MICVATMSRHRWTGRWEWCREKRIRGKVIMLRRVARSLVSVASPTIVLYAALVLPATGCASMPLSSSGTHHHSQESTHAPLCAWSCQMVSKSGLVASVPMVVVTLVAILMVSPVLHAHYGVSSASSASRAPPVPMLGSFRRNAFLDRMNG